MKTLVFHSVKGGVGRTLALCNLARSLASAGKRVLMLDFDYSAPGLHYKWKRAAGPGYLEYLDAFDVEDRAGGVSERKRWNVLRDSTETIDKDLYLLRAGNETSPDYWRLIASYRFHRLFYFAPKEVNGLNARTFPLEWLDLNREAFDKDKQLIEEHFEPDYFLVDCRTSTEPSAIMLLSWANSIAHFLPPNTEGAQYACGTAQAVVRQMVRRAQPIGFVPVIARVPDHRSEEMDEDHIGKVREAWGRKRWSGEERSYAAGVFREQDFVILSETRAIEDRERILLGSGKTKDILWQLSHDYLALFARLAPPPGIADPTEAEAWWYQQSGMNPDARILAKQFDRYLHLGTMLNVDNQANIAMRVKTFHLLLQGLLDKCLPDLPETQRNALVAAGHRCGEDFAAELNDTFTEKAVEPSLTKRIKAWADFDSGVGFGAISALQVDEATHEVWLQVIGDAFAQLPDEQGKDLRRFFEGYVEGVIEGVIEGVLQGVVAQDVPIRLAARSTAVDELPPGLRADVQPDAGQSDNRLSVSYYQVFFASTENHVQA